MAWSLRPPKFADHAFPTVAAKLDDAIDDASDIGHDFIVPEPEIGLHDHKADLLQRATGRIGMDGRDRAGVSRVDGS